MFLRCAILLFDTVLKIMRTILLVRAATSTVFAFALIWPACANAGQAAPDGLPVSIPPPASPPPIVTEWNAVNWQVAVKNASTYHCETKMVREWLRAVCSPYDGWTLKDVKTIQSGGVQALVGVFGFRAQVVVRVVRGKTYVARFIWGPDNSTRDLTVNWQSNGLLPSIYFN